MSIVNTAFRKKDEKTEFVPTKHLLQAMKYFSLLQHSKNGDVKKELLSVH